MQEIFILFIGIFRLLEDPASPLFTRCLSVLELFSQVSSDQAWSTCRSGMLQCQLGASRELCVADQLECWWTLQVKCVVLMLDWEDEEMVCDLFQVLCEAIKYVSSLGLAFVATSTGQADNELIVHC